MSGIRDLIPGSVIDATMFNPCGYSMNGMKSDVSFSLAYLNINFQFYLFCDNNFFFCSSGNLLDYSHHSRTRILLR